MRFRSLTALAAIAAVALLTAPAQAVQILTIGQDAPMTVGPQSSSNPCIIAATQCQQPAGFGFNNFVSNGGTSSYDEFSTTPTATLAQGVQGTPYTVGQFVSAGLTAFNINIDVNTTNAAGEILDSFQVFVNNTLFADYQPTGTQIGLLSSNGNGFADWTLSSVDLTGIALNAPLFFHAVWHNASDGGESFFVSAANATPVPEPGSLALFGGGLLLLGVLGKLRRRRSEPTDTSMPA